MRHFFRVIGVCALAMLAGGLPAAAAPLRLRGIVIALDGTILYMKADDGGQHKVRLAGTKVFAMTPATLADIKPDAFVGVLTTPDKQALRAVAINILPPAARGLNEGQGPWDMGPDSLMTNAYVTRDVTGVAAHRLTLKYKGAEAEVLVSPETKVVAMTPSDLRELSPGSHVLVFATTGADGALEAGTLVAGHGSFVPPI